jgi:hypothetical protein
MEAGAGSGKKLASPVVLPGVIPYIQIVKRNYIQRMARRDGYAGQKTGKSARFLFGE